MPIHIHIFRHAILTHEVGQTDLVSGVQSGFLGRFVRTRFQVSVCRCYDLCHCGWPKIWFLHLDPCDLEKWVKL